jgi:hypothetical protein
MQNRRSKMKQSESINKLAMALVKAQAEMGGAVKDSKNPFFKSSYADLTSVIKAIKEPFANNGLAYIQFPISGEKSAGVITRLVHESGEWLEQDYMMPLIKNDSQSFGSILSYARRYSLSAMAGIPAVDDDSESAMIRVDKIDTNMIDLISDLIEKTESDIEKFCTVFNVPSINKMTMVQAEKALAMLERKNAK